MNGDEIIGVGALTTVISERLDNLGNLQVRGEISQGRVVASGHYYATLKDRDAVISLVCWRSTAARLGNRLPKEGDEVVVRGKLSVYGPRGQYQLVATGFRAVGAGDLAAQFEALKQKLSAERLFDPEHKRELPYLPQGVGIATASGSAAEADMLDSIGTRFPDMLVTVMPCLVQGPQAAATIVQALQQLDADPDVEVIILGRGGGSLEDLWAFNEESVLRAIAACAKPVISAVGHETDVTLADFVADVRAKTPTAAGELVVPVQADLLDEVAELHERLDAAINLRLAAAEQRLEALDTHRALITPRHQWEVRSQRLDELQERLTDLLPRRFDAVRQQWQQQRNRLQQLRPQLETMQAQLPEHEKRLRRTIKHAVHDMDQRFRGLVGRLDALSPLAVIARGYSVLTTEEGGLIRDSEQVQPGNSINARLHEGRITATVTATGGGRVQEASDIYQAAPPQTD
jgi:exodeoxyribonuclease VII large subunit